MITKEKRIEYKNNYIKKHGIIKIKEQKRKSYIKNRKKILDYEKRRYKKNKDYIKNRMKNYRLNNPDKIKKQSKKYYNKSDKKIKKYQKEYRRENKDYINKREINYYRNDKIRAISGRLRTLLRRALLKYTKTGKIMSSKKYGVNYESIIKHLKPFPSDLNGWQIDHIKPLCSFNFINKDGSTNLEEVKRAFASKNHQWLTAEKNNSKGRKIEIQQKIIW